MVFSILSVTDTRCNEKLIDLPSVIYEWWLDCVPVRLEDLISVPSRVIHRSLGFPPTKTPT
jgi:hypothetical protein